MQRAETIFSGVEAKNLKQKTRLFDAKKWKEKKIDLLC